MTECIKREAAIKCCSFGRTSLGLIDELRRIPAANVVEIPATGIGDLSDGYHTFNGLYHQRMILFAAIVKQNKDKAWKSYRHEDGELCFGGGWFIVGIDTPEGSYTYHYENKDFDLFDCEELPVAKHWDGHTEKDVARLLSLPATNVRKVVLCRDCMYSQTDERGLWCFNDYENCLSGDDFCSRGKRRDTDMRGGG